MTPISLIDWAASACLCDVGASGWVAATLVDADGNTDLVLVDQRLLHADDVANRYHPGVPAALHEQSGPLPIEVVRRITLAQRTHYCGRRTAHGHPCRLRVERPGDPCAFHQF